MKIPVRELTDFELAAERLHARGEYHDCVLNNKPKTRFWRSRLAQLDDEFIRRGVYEKTKPMWRGQR